MKDRVIFRRAIFGGLNKQDVMEYVDSLESENESLQVEMNKKTDRLMAQISTLEEKLSNAGDSELVERLRARLRESQILQKEYQDKLSIAGDPELIEQLRAQLRESQALQKEYREKLSHAAGDAALVEQLRVQLRESQILQREYKEKLSNAGDAEMVKQLRAQLQESQILQREYARKLEFANQRSDDLESQLTAAQTRIQSNVDLENSVEARVELIQKDAARIISEQNEQAQKFLASAKKRTEVLVNQLNDRIAELENSVSEETEKSDFLKKRTEVLVNQLNGRIAELENSISEQTEKTTYLQSVLDEKEFQLEKLRRELDELQSMNDHKEEFVDETLGEEIEPTSIEGMSDLDSIFAATMESLENYGQMANKKVISIAMSAV